MNETVIVINNTGGISAGLVITDRAATIHEHVAGAECVGHGANVNLTAGYQTGGITSGKTATAIICRHRRRRGCRMTHSLETGCQAERKSYRHEI